MPKVVINDAKGVTQSRGSGLHQLAANGRGFVQEVRSGQFSSGVTTASVSTGITIPSNAIVEYVSIKLVSGYSDDDGSNNSCKILGLTFGGNAYTFHVDAVSQVQAHAEGTPQDDGSVRSYSFAPIDEDASQDRTSVEAIKTSTSPSGVTAQVQLTGGSDGTTDTQAVYQISVLMTQPLF